MRCKWRKFENTFIYHCKEILRVDTYDIWGRMFHEIFYIIYLASTVTEKSFKDTNVKTDSLCDLK